MAEPEGLAGRQIGFDFRFIDLALDFIGQGNDNQCGAFDGLGNRGRLEAVLDGQLIVSGIGQFSNLNLNTAVPQVLCVGMPLTAVADDGNGLALKGRDGGVILIIHFSHGRILLFKSKFQPLSNL